VLHILESPFSLNLLLRIRYGPNGKSDFKIGLEIRNLWDSARNSSWEQEKMAANPAGKKYAQPTGCAFEEWLQVIDRLP